MASRLFQIKSKYFTAGLTVDSKGYVVKAAPILSKAIGLKWENVEAFYKRRGCKIENVEKANG